MSDMVNHPPHYTQHPSGIECIDLSERLPANLSHAFKYLWRAGLKGGEDKAREDRLKALFYLRREMALLDDVGSEAPLKAFLKCNDDTVQTLILAAAMADDAKVFVRPAIELLIDRVSEQGASE